MEFKHLLLELAEHVALITIDAPATMNALNSEILRELERALSKVDADEEVKAVVITGAGEKAFVAGADIREMSTLSPLEAHRFSLKGQGVLLRIGKMQKPVIAAVNGYALGGGLELALACDFIYASTGARFGFPEVTLGVMPGFGGTQNLARLVGPNRAKEMIFTGRIINADKALAWGIVNEILPPEQLLAKTRETAGGIAGVGPLGVAHAKDAIVHGLNMTKEDGLRYEASLFGVLFDSADQKEGMGAFLEKRRANFKNK